MRLLGDTVEVGSRDLVAYELAAKEIYRLVGLFEGLFSRHKLYCDTVIVADDVQFRWRSSHKGFEYLLCNGSASWVPVKNVFNMEIAATLLENMRTFYAAACEEQDRVTQVLESAVETGNTFASSLISKEQE